MFYLDGRRKHVLIISDTHIPYSHIDYIKFLTAVKKKYKPNLVLHIGDEVDSHAISFHDTDTSLFSADKELDNSIIEIQEGLHKLFPKMYLLESNHGSLIFRKMKACGLPIRHLKPLNELYETPLWSWHFEIILNTLIGQVFLCHGRSGTYSKMCKEAGMHAIQGHFHGKGEITWHRTATVERYNMFLGCLVDEDSMAMAYGRNNLPKPILSVGFINKAGNPLLIKMHLDKNNRWTGKL